MKAKVLTLGYVGQIVAYGLSHHIVRLASGTLVITPTQQIEWVE